MLNDVHLKFCALSLHRFLQARVVASAPAPPSLDIPFCCGQCTERQLFLSSAIRIAYALAQVMICSIYCRYVPSKETLPIRKFCSFPELYSTLNPLSYSEIHQYWIVLREMSPLDYIWGAGVNNVKIYYSKQTKSQESELVFWHMKQRKNGDSTLR